MTHFLVYKEMFLTFIYLYLYVHNVLFCGKGGDNMSIAVLVYFNVLKTSPDDGSISRNM